MLKYEHLQTHTSLAPPNHYVNITEVELNWDHIIYSLPHKSYQEKNTV